MRNQKQLILTGAVALLATSLLVASASADHHKKKGEKEASCPTFPLIGETAPAFEAVTTQGKISFPADYKGSWVVLFSHPADFTPVCTTEFIGFAKLMPQFNAINCKLIGLSIDSNYSHIAWLRTIKEKINYKGNKGVEVKFPVIADLKMDVAKKYGMVQPSADDTPCGSRGVRDRSERKGPRGPLLSAE